jgi:hypothetical protein
MQRDGWVHNSSEKSWSWQFQTNGATLEARYFRHTADLQFRLREYPELLNQEVEWATFTANGDLVFSHLGWVYRYDRKAIRNGKPSFAADLNLLTREQIQKVK